jgi:hypothetical protein
MSAAIWGVLALSIFCLAAMIYAIEGIRNAWGEDDEENFF